MTTGRESVFVVSDLIQRLQSNKEWFSKTVFDGIAKKATEGDVAAVNWLVEHGFMSVVYFDEIIVVPAGVREAVERVRGSGESRHDGRQPGDQGVREAWIPEGGSMVEVHSGGFSGWRRPRRR